VTVVLLYLGLIFVALDIASNSRDRFDNIVAGGIAIYFGVQSFINMGMVMGLLPVVGVPLPLVSAGGSSVMASLIALGILNNIHIKSKSFI
jgi:rod shape determining protein RodA